MEMFALIKDNNGTRIVKGNDVQEKANLVAREKLNDFFDYLIKKNGENYKVSLGDADLFESYGGPFSRYVADKVLRNNIIKKKRFEVKKILSNLFNEFNLDTKLITYINNNYNLFSCFYSGKNGNVCFDMNTVNFTFDRVFGELISEQLILELKRQLSVNNYSLEYSVLELKNFLLSDNIINLNRKNFESLLYELGEISDPLIPASTRHKCYSCDNLSPLLCKKAEFYKKKIDDYSFINDGYQVYMTTNYKDFVMTSFIVEDCDNYKACNDNSIDKEEYSYIKRMRK